MQMQCIDIMHRMMIHMIVLIIENIKQLQINKLENAIQKQKKVSYLLEQAINVGQWV